MSEKLSMQAVASAAKEASFLLAASAAAARNSALLAVADALEANREAIFAANAKDMECAKADGIAAPVLKRLKFDEGKLADVCAGLRALAQMDDPIGYEQLKTELADGLVLSRVACPGADRGPLPQERQRGASQGRPRGDGVQSGAV